MINAGNGMIQEAKRFHAGDMEGPKEGRNPAQTDFIQMNKSSIEEKLLEEVMEEKKVQEEFSDEVNQPKQVNEFGERKAKFLRDHEKPEQDIDDQELSDEPGTTFALFVGAKVSKDVEETLCEANVSTKEKGLPTKSSLRVWKAEAKSDELEESKDQAVKVVNASSTVLKESVEEKKESMDVRTLETKTELTEGKTEAKLSEKEYVKCLGGKGLENKIASLGLSTLFMNPEKNKPHQLKLLVGDVQGGKTEAVFFTMLKLRESGYTQFFVGVRDMKDDERQQRHRLERFQISNFGKKIFHVVYIGDKETFYRLPRDKPTVFFFLCNKYQTETLNRFLNKDRQGFPNEKRWIGIDESDYHLLESETGIPSATATNLRLCNEMVDRVDLVTATPYSHIVHNKKLRVCDLAFLTVGENYNGIQDLEIIANDFVTKTSKHKSCWEDIEVKSVVDDILCKCDFARVLLNVNRKVQQQKESVISATVPDNTAFLTYNGSDKNVIKIKGIHTLSSSFLKQNQNPQETKDGTVVVEWDRNGVQIGQIFDELEQAGITKVVVVAYDLAARGITFPNLTHQILVRSTATSITNLYQSLRICGYWTPGYAKRNLKKILYTTEGVRQTLLELVQFNSGIRELVINNRNNGNAFVANLLNTSGIKYNQFVRQIVSPTKGLIQQSKVNGTFPEVNTLKTKAKKQKKKTNIQKMLEQLETLQFQ